MRLYTLVLNYTEQNLMTVNNLAIVLGPSILYDRDCDEFSMVSEGEGGWRGARRGEQGKDEENEGREGGIREATAMKGWEGKIEDEEMKEKKEWRKEGPRQSGGRRDRGRTIERNKKGGRRTRGVQPSS
jgi:hypothetical protein